jgi:hypothetical protein
MIQQIGIVKYMANLKFLKRIEELENPCEYLKAFTWIYQQNFSQSRINTNLAYLQRIY